MNQKTLAITSIIASFMGLIDSVYLTVLKVTENKQMCVQGAGDCWSVNTSPYSEVFGIPVALLGAIAYIVLIAIFFMENRAALLQQYGPYLVFGITLTGTLFSAYLTYVEIAVIRAVCLFCVVSALIMLVLFVIAILRLIGLQAENNP